MAGETIFRFREKSNAITEFAQVGILHVKIHSGTFRSLGTQTYLMSADFKLFMSLSDVNGIAMIKAYLGHVQRCIFMCRTLYMSKLTFVCGVVAMDVKR